CRMWARSAMPPVRIRISSIGSDFPTGSAPEILLPHLAHEAAQDAFAPLAEGTVGGEVGPGGTALGGVQSFGLRLRPARGNFVIESRFHFPVGRIHSRQVLVQR